jgi:hypothetical protein
MRDGLGVPTTTEPDMLGMDDDPSLLKKGELSFSAENIPS